MRFLLEDLHFDVTTTPDILFNFVDNITEFEPQDFSAMIKFLKNRNVNINDKDFSGLTPMHYACIDPKHNLQKTEILMSHGAGVNIQDNNDNTALHFACKHSDSENAISIIEKLILAHANISLKDKANLTARQILKNKQAKIRDDIKLLEKAHDISTSENQFFKDFSCRNSLNFYYLTTLNKDEILQKEKEDDAIVTKCIQAFDQAVQARKEIKLMKLEDKPSPESQLMAAEDRLSQQMKYVIADINQKKYLGKRNFSVFQEK